jgi:hypothetical protein
MQQVFRSIGAFVIIIASTMSVSLIFLAVH